MLMIEKFLCFMLDEGSFTGIIRTGWRCQVKISFYSVKKMFFYKSKDVKDSMGGWGGGRAGQKISYRKYNFQSIEMKHL